MTELVVVVPVLARPERVEPLLWSLDHGRGVIPYRALFVASPDDRKEQEAILAANAEMLVADWPAGPGDWARKINLALQETTEPWLFTGADDLCFCPGWADAALACAAATGASVIGTNDLGNDRVVRGEHATHSLVGRTYATLEGTIDEPGLLLHEGYDHSFVDDELVATAKARGAWHWCGESMVEHLHPHWSKGSMDATYRKGLARFADDRRLFQRRRRLLDGARVRGGGRRPVE